MNDQTLNSLQVKVTPLRTGATWLMAIGKARLILSLGFLVALTTAGSCNSPALFQSNFDTTAVGQPPSPTQAAGTASVDGPTGSVLVVAAPPTTEVATIRLRRVLSTLTGSLIECFSYGEGSAKRAIVPSDAAKVHVLACKCLNHKGNPEWSDGAMLHRVW